LLTLPPVRGSVAGGSGVGVEVRDGVEAGAEELAETDVAASGCESGLLRAAATPMPPVTTIAAAATTTVRARFMS
jgi:hypothetical protein